MMTPLASAAKRLAELLSLASPPVAVTFDAVTEPTAAPTAAEPAGCCFWAPAQSDRIDTVAADHANCSVGSYTHGLISLGQAATGADTAALVGSGWVEEQDLVSAAALKFRPETITYQPLATADRADVALVRVSATGLMTLMGAAPDLAMAAKPQCVIVPLAMGGQVAVSPGCAVSRVRTALPHDDLTCAIPGAQLATIIERLEASTAADRVVGEFAAADLAENFARA